MYNIFLRISTNSRNSCRRSIKTRRKYEGNTWGQEFKKMHNVPRKLVFVGKFQKFRISSKTIAFTIVFGRVASGNLEMLIFNKLRILYFCEYPQILENPVADRSKHEGNTKEIYGDMNVAKNTQHAKKIVFSGYSRNLESRRKQ